MTPQKPPTEPHHPVEEAISNEPTPTISDPSSPHAELYKAVGTALFAPPSFFKSDLVTFNTSLGATIEAQVVAGLNELRTTWHPEQRYATYRFVRQSQRFPDVILRSAVPDADPLVLMGIELKGWYALAKEREPSFRYKVTPAVCAPPDLLVVYPWVLSSVVSGSPQLYEPFVTNARFAAEYRNWHWQHRRKTSGNSGITLSSVTHHYPDKSDAISDQALSDGGKNFGRFARTGLMDDYMDTLFQQDLSGIPLSAWQRFLAIFSESRPETEITRILDRLAGEFASRDGTAGVRQFIVDLLDQPDQ